MKQETPYFRLIYPTFFKSLQCFAKGNKKRKKKPVGIIRKSFGVEL